MINEYRITVSNSETQIVYRTFYATPEYAQEVYESYKTRYPDTVETPHYVTFAQRHITGRWVWGFVTITTNRLDSGAHKPLGGGEPTESESRSFWTS